MKKLATLSFMFLCLILTTSCSSDLDQSPEINSFLGRWEAKEISYKEGTKFIKKPYKELKEFSKNEILEIYTDDNNTVELIQYPANQEEPKIYFGTYSYDQITLSGLSQVRIITKISGNYITIATRMIIDDKLTDVSIEYATIGPPRDPEK
ncbi:hypothetical protein [Myroides sp. LJL119]